MFILFIFFIFGCMVLAMFIVVFSVIQNNKALNIMDKKIEDFEKKKFSSVDEKEEAKQLLKKELIKIKATMSDKKATEQAGDKISIL